MVPQAQIDSIVLEQFGKGKSDVDIAKWVNRMAVYHSHQPV
jgi:hypothetical protein